MLRFMPRAQAKAYFKCVLACAVQVFERNHHHEAVICYVGPGLKAALFQRGGVSAH